MIGQLTVKISANDPTKKCETFRAFVGSPSNVRIVGVPSSLGNWKIQTVYFTVNYPDNLSVGKTCKAGVGVYVATVEGSTLPGKSLLGYTVKADGVDENGNPVIGYVLGKGDVEIVDADATLTPGETTHYIHVLESRPENQRKGDAYVENGTWRFYNGTSWTVLGGVSAGNSYVMAPVDRGGDGLWHRMIVVDGTIAYEREGVSEPPLAADKPWVLTRLEDAVSAEAERASSAEEANAAAISNHASATGNPHGVTKSQVGLGNVDNTSDADKPVSTAMQTELNAKANDNAVVKLTGEQTIDGTKTFNGVVTSNGGFACGENGTVKGSAFATAGMPSRSAIDYTPEQFNDLGISATNITAPTTGYLMIDVKAGAAGEYVYVSRNSGNSSYRLSQYSRGTENLRILFPALKGSGISIQFTASGGVNVFRFIKCSAEVAQ